MLDSPAAAPNDQLSSQTHATNPWSQENMNAINIAKTACRNFAVLFICVLLAACGGGSGDTTPATNSITGTVSGAAKAGVTISLTGAATATTTTDAAGNYSFASLASGSYTVTPSKNGYSFNPANFAFSVSGANVSGKNFTAAGKINDTGITASQCYQAGSDSLVACTSAGATAVNNAQDGMVGRDANPATNDNADGKLGFSFTAVTGGCVQDNVTGLMWEVKTLDGELRGWVHSYTNYGNNSAADASTFVTAVNASNLCGHNDWRLPTVDELQSIVDYSVADPGPTIDTTWFPHTMGYVYWSSSPSFVDSSYNAWNVNFYDGVVGVSGRDQSLHVRLVRAGQ
jgi:hypothetical protein